MYYRYRQQNYLTHSKLIAFWHASIIFVFSLKENRKISIHLRVRFLLVTLYIDVASDYKFMRCGGSDRDQGVKFVKKKRKRFRKGRWWGWTIDIEERDFRLRQLESNWGMFKWRKLGHRSRQLSEGFTYKKTSTTTNDCRRIALRRGTRSAQESVIRWSTVFKFSEGSWVFYPSFSETEQIWMMGNNKIRQSSRMESVNIKVHSTIIS